MADITNVSTEPGSWNEAVLRVLRAHPGHVSLSVIYGEVGKIAPTLIAQNSVHWHDKIRQRLQVLGRRGILDHPRKGVWGVKPQGG